MRLLTDQPGVQFYSGNFLDGTSVGKNGQIHRMGDALCLEPQRYPDSPNRADYPSARLDPARRIATAQSIASCMPDVSGLAPEGSETEGEKTMSNDLTKIEGTDELKTAGGSRGHGRAGHDAALARLVRQSGQRRHDGALSRALHELRPQPGRASVRPPDHRHRADGLRPLALQPHHLELANRLREGIREAGGIAIEFRSTRSRKRAKRPTAGLDRNLAYLGLVEILYGYPLDGVVLTIGCDKTTPACLMAGATVNISGRSPSRSARC